jgi:hypothetical protein
LRLLMLCTERGCFELECRPEQAVFDTRSGGHPEGGVATRLATNLIEQSEAAHALAPSRPAFSNPSQSVRQARKNPGFTIRVPERLEAVEGEPISLDGNRELSLVLAEERHHPMHAPENLNECQALRHRLEACQLRERGLGLGGVQARDDDALASQSRVGAASRLQETAGIAKDGAGGGGLEEDVVQALALA